MCQQQGTPDCGDTTTAMACRVLDATLPSGTSLPRHCLILLGRIVPAVGCPP